MTSIRRLTPADLDDWSPLWAAYLEFYGSELDDVVTAATFRRLTEGVELHGAIARDDDGRAIGIVHWLTHAGTWTTTGYTYLEDLYVASTARGTGAGRALIAHVADWARAHGFEKVYWLTQDENAPARRLYDQVALHTGYTHYEIEL